MSLSARKQHQQIEPPRMMQEQEGAAVARERYMRSLSSNIFSACEPVPRVVKSNPNTIGLRQDHTTAEFFAHMDDPAARSLKKAPDTFQPKDLHITSHQRKMHDMYGPEALHRASKYPTQPLPQDQEPSQPFKQTAIRPVSGLLPSSVDWSTCQAQNQNQHASSKLGQQISTVFGDSHCPNYDPESTVAVENETSAEKDRRRYDRHYSNIFHNDATDLENMKIGTEMRRLKPSAARDAGLTPFMDAMDSRTEVVKMKEEEHYDAFTRAQATKHESHIPGLDTSSYGMVCEKKRFNDDCLDSSRPKVTNVSPKTALQLALQSNITFGGEKSQAAEGVVRKCGEGAFRVVALMARGLHRETTERELRSFARSEEVQLASVKVEMDPITHYCKGRARIVVRESLGDAGAERLVRFLEARGVTCDVEEPTDLNY